MTASVGRVLWRHLPGPGRVVASGHDQGLTDQDAWVYLHAIIGCSHPRAGGLVARAALPRAARLPPASRGPCSPAAYVAGTLTLGTDSGSQFTSRDFRRHLSANGIIHHRSDYLDPESQAFISPGSGSSRSGWRSAPSGSRWTRREGRSPATSTSTHQRPHPGRSYLTPTEVAATWRPNPDVLQSQAT